MNQLLLSLLEALLERRDCGHSPVLCGPVFRRLRLEIIDFLLHFKISSPGLSGLELSCYSGLFFSSKFCLNFAQLNPWKICQLFFHYVEEPLSDKLILDDDGLCL